ncbi:UNVERIFIED_CONTAM: hypothetical protein FKN15_049449 [Acipenser sinensis]
MTTRSEREKALKLNEQHQAILSKMLREEDNKYCADCEAKGLSNTFELKVILADTVNLHSVNYSSVAQGVVKCLTAFEVNFNNVTGYVSDNASYMIKVYNDLKFLQNNINL